MLRGEKVYLRAREAADVPVLHRELYDDVAGWSHADSRPWRPRPPATGSPYDVAEPTDGVAPFSVVGVAGDDLLGEALLWGIDLHNRYAHLGVALLPSVRGQGFGTETVRLLTGYAFEVLGLHRVQLETLADNAAMIASAERVGYRLEARLREVAWVLGSFVDEVVMGLVVTDDVWSTP